MNVTQAYRTLIAQRAYRADPAQERVVERLQQLHEEFVRYKSRRSNAFKRLVIHPPVPKGVYIWGGVGRGKSFLMDVFYSVVPVLRKTRVHFHAFMRDVHRELETLKGTPDPLQAVAWRLARRYRLICFDEFHISDIADAMILYRLLEALLALRVCFVMTSNYAPRNLYPDGLHRDRLLPALDLLETQLDVLCLDSNTDYRALNLTGVDTYLHPLNDAQEKRMTAIFERLSDGLDETPVLHIEHRQIPCRRLSGSLVWFDFDVLCGGPRSQNDYLEMAQRFTTVLLSNVPRMGPRHAAEARRFTWFIDITYDHGVKLIVSAQVPPEQIYEEGPLAGEFQRTVSRLREMSSPAYLARSKRV